MLLTEQEAADRAKVSLKTIKRLIAQKRLDFVSFGTGLKKKVRITEEALEHVRPALEPTPPPLRRRRQRSSSAAKCVVCPSASD